MRFLKPHLLASVRMHFMSPLLVAAFYRFVTLENLEFRRESLLKLCGENQVRGTILLACEGINATICGDEKSLYRVLDVLRSDLLFADLSPKFSLHDEMPFARLKVKIKPEIVTLGLPEINPNQGVGVYVKPHHWNALISQPDVLVIDARNDYEISIGSFENAIDPQTRSFRQFPAFVEANLPDKNQKIAMLCTGGIRCEKASALLLQKGFAHVYHLEGGVLKYLEEVAPSENLFRGECFVFDERVSLDNELQRGHFTLCETCGNPVVENETLCKNCE